MTEHRAPVVVEIILERITKIAMRLDIDGIVEFEDLSDPALDAPSPSTWIEAMNSPPAERILVAPDRFTGTLCAPLVGAHAAPGFRDASPAPVIGIDGGDLGQPST
ncbi:hypothetical protein [Pseudonocardia alaniniphila]|uniref:Uncharacterized protein n=1 Tax=Pseudonocardia alaniniphila TaxID=75291 RepID=A0ABS9TD58_9PSEU|nr:hypothetical protein [Pseudonocardia alaniniphila]MCH6166333.1 hypothetical protein [Pseudonocardia alaniniphila]